MQAVKYIGHGGPDVIEYGSVPDPEPGASEVLVDIKAGALNHLDVWTRNGLPGLDLEMPHIPGSDAAGVYCGDCEFCRNGESPLCVEFTIIGEHTPGVHSELAAVHEDNLVAVPGSVDWETAAAAPLVFGTAWRMLVTRADLSPGETVLVMGASGGVGHAAVQIAADAGAEVFAAAGSEGKLDSARELGADHAIDYGTEEIPDAVRAATDKRGVDVVVDHVGGETWGDSLRALARGGRLVTCGATAGPNPRTDIPRIFGNQLAILGSTMATPGEVDDVLAKVWDGTYEVRIRETLPMSETAQAHELLEDREGFGKVVVVPDSER